jgi:hypothetical protein
LSLGRASALVLFVAMGCGFGFETASYAQNTPPVGADQDIAALLSRLEENIAKNEKVAHQYASDIVQTESVSDMKGKVLSHHTDKRELVFINGLPYMRRVEIDGRPLSARKQKASQVLLDSLRDLAKDYEFTLELVGKDPHSYIFSGLPICCLGTSFDNRVVGHEVIDGRDNLVIESIPRANASPGSDKEKTALDWKETTWVDVQDVMPTRYDVELVNDKKYLVKGTTTSIDFMRMEAAGTADGGPKQVVWLMRSGSGHLEYLWQGQRTREIAEDRRVNYRKFRSDMRMLDDSVRVVPSDGVANP